MTKQLWIKDSLAIVNCAVAQTLVYGKIMIRAPSTWIETMNPVLLKHHTSRQNSQLAL